RRALQARDRGCRFPGCTHTRFVDAHHVQHWAQGGETKASNLVLLCRRHHRFVHEGGVRIEVLDDGAFRFVKPDGQALDSLPPQRRTPSAWTQLALHHAGGSLGAPGHGRDALDWRISRLRARGWRAACSGQTRQRSCIDRTQRRDSR
ncbi:MAG: HNH endonuclease, partial [Steroidobacteraceae bacterium]|nr:HNH endonuclease [Steroidobacteraceae bacterium]